MTHYPENEIDHIRFAHEQAESLPGEFAKALTVVCPICGTPTMVMEHDEWRFNCTCNKSKETELVCPNCGLTGEQAKLPHTCRKAEPPAGKFTERAQEPLLTWDKPRTSYQAAKYLMTNGFVAVELYRVQQQEIEKLNELVFAYESVSAPVNPLIAENAKLKEHGVITANALVKRIRENKAQVERIEKLEKAISLLNSMVEGEESHSATSRRMVEQALKGK